MPIPVETIQRELSHSPGTGTNTRYGTIGRGLMTWYVTPPAVTVSSEPGGNVESRLPRATLVAMVIARSVVYSGCAIATAIVVAT